MAALEPLATSSDLAKRLRVTYDVAEAAQVDLLLADASDELRAITGQPLSRATSTVEFHADRRGQVWLPTVPVVEITSVEHDGTAITNFRVRGRILYLPAGVGTDDAVTVTFVHGWDPIPGELVKWACVLASAAKTAADLTGSMGVTAGVGRRQESIDDYSRQIDAPGGGQDPALGMTLPQGVAERLRATYGLGGIAWLGVDG